MRPLASSFGFHLIFLLALLFIHFNLDQRGEIPIEITEFIRTTTGSNLKQNMAPKRQNETKKVSVSDLGPPSQSLTPPTLSPSSGQGVPGFNEPVAEEYEITSLPVLIKEVRVPYPAQAKALRETGVVVFDLLIGSNGRVADAKVIESSAEVFKNAALPAIKNFEFKPAILKDKPVAIRIRYTYRFVLE